MTELNFVDYHGILMIAAWSLTAVAISAAHYLPSVWRNKKFLGNPIWFNIHRTCNLLAVLLILISLFFIIYEKAAWTGPWFGLSTKVNTSGPKWHSLIGAIAALMAICQGFGALIFRYAPHHSRYQTISYVHRKVGKGACIAAAIAMFIAILTFTKHFASLVVAVTVFVCFFIVLFWLAIGTNILAWQRVQKTAVGHAVIHHIGSDESGVRRRDTTKSEMAEEEPPYSDTHQILFFFFKSGFALLTACILIFLIITH